MGTFKNAEAALPILRTLFSVIILSFNPDVIVLSGGWSKLRGMKKILNQVSKDVGGYKNGTRVYHSRFAYPGVVGVAALVFSSQQQGR